jgi:hypothetical protein
MLILSWTCQRSRIYDRRSERWYFDVVRRHINAVQRRHRQLPIDHGHRK